MKQDAEKGIMNRPETALKAFAGGANCAQAVLAAFAEEHGLDRETAMALARGFGSGMATGSVCGAASGGIMALGLASGIGADNTLAKPVCYRMVQEFSRRFLAKHGSLVCRDLIGCDLTDPARLAEARKIGLFATVCAPLIRDAVVLVEEIAGPGGQPVPTSRDK